MKLSAKIAGISMFVLMVSIIPVTLAGVPPFFTELNGVNNIVAPVFGFHDTFDSSQDIYFATGIYRSIEEAEVNSFPAGPYKIKLWVDGEKVPLQRFSAKREDGDPPRIWVWYHVFGPDYFTPDQEYTIYMEMWVFREFEGSDIQAWQIYFAVEYMIYFF